MSKWIRGKKIKVLWKIASEEKDFQSLEEFLNYIKVPPKSNSSSWRNEPVDMGDGIYGIPIENSNYFPNLKYIKTNQKGLTLDFTLFEKFDDFMNLVYEKMNSPRTISYFKKLYKFEGDDFLERANKFCNSIKDFFIFSGWRQNGGRSHASADEITLYYDLSNERGDLEVVLHEFFHYFNRWFTSLSGESAYADEKMKKGDHGSIESIIEKNIRRFDDNSMSEKIYDAMYNSDEAENLMQYTNNDGYEPSFEVTCKPDQNDVRVIKEEFVEWASKLFSKKFREIYYSAFDWAKEKKASTPFGEDLNTTMMAYGFIRDILIKQKSESLFSELTQRYIHGFLENSNRIDLEEFYAKNILSRFYSYIGEEANKNEDLGFYSFIPSRAARDVNGGIYNLFFNWAIKNSKEYRAGYERCTSALKALKEYNDHVTKVEKDLMEKAKVEEYTSVGTPKEREYPLQDRVYISTKSSVPSNYQINRVLKKHYGEEEAKRITENFSLTPEQVEEKESKIYGFGKGSNIMFFTKRNLEHQNDKSHKGGVAIRTLYWTADKYVSNHRDPQEYEDFFLKLLKLEFPDEMYKDTELCRSLLLFINYPEHNAKALSSYYDLAKADTGKSDSVPV